MPVYRPSIPGRILKIFGVLGRIDQQLLGNAAPYDACPAKTGFFCNSNFLAHRCGDAPGPYATRAPTNDKQVIIKIGHDASSSLLFPPIKKTDFANKKPGNRFWLPG
jgi:hypothetical protein